MKKVVRVEVWRGEGVELVVSVGIKDGMGAEVVARVGVWRGAGVELVVRVGKIGYGRSGEGGCWLGFKPPTHFFQKFRNFLLPFNLTS